MAIETDRPDEHPQDEHAVDDDPQPDPVVVPVGGLLESSVGPLRDRTLSMADAETLAWQGIDVEGNPSSGIIRLRPAMTDDGGNAVAFEVVSDDDPSMPGLAEKTP